MHVIHIGGSNIRRDFNTLLLNFKTAYSKRCCEFLLNNLQPIKQFNKLRQKAARITLSCHETPDLVLLSGGSTLVHGHSSRRPLVPRGLYRRRRVHLLIPCSHWILRAGTCDASAGHRPPSPKITLSFTITPSAASQRAFQVGRVPLRRRAGGFAMLLSGLTRQWRDRFVPMK